jgi:hypothetical protein
MFLSAYIPMLLYIMGQKVLYVDLWRGMRRSSVDEKVLVSA